MEHSATSVAGSEIFSTIIDSGTYHDSDRHFTPDYIDHSAVDDLHGTDAFSGMLEGSALRCPGLRHEISDLTLIGTTWIVAGASHRNLRR